MQDSKEQPPPAPSADIVKMSKFKISSDANPREIFWAMAEAYREGGGEFGKLARQYGGMREPLVNIGCSILNEDQKRYRVKISKTRLAMCIFSMLAEGGWEDVLERLLSNLYSRKKGPDVHMLVAFGKGFAAKKELVGGWIAQALEQERPSEALLSYIMHCNEPGMVRFLKEPLLNIARTEINEPQVYAMEALGALLPDDMEARKVFVDMMDDWDTETRKAALETLIKHRIPEAGAKAVMAYVHEPDEKFRILLEHVVENNAEECIEAFLDLSARLGGSELEQLRKLATKVFGEEGAAEIFPAGGGKGKKKKKGA